MIKTGLYFGSFNPIHIGHLAIAGYMIEFTAIDQLWFVVSPQNPLKRKDSLLADYHRLELVRRAIDDDDRFRVSDIEFKMPKPSYTIDTLTYLEEKHPNHQFSLIMGVLGGMPPTADNLAHQVRLLPPNSDWEVIGISHDQWRMVATAIALGGNVRVGLEDNFYVHSGVMAKSNGDLVEKAAKMIQDQGRTVATAEECRERLGLKHR